MSSVILNSFIEVECPKFVSSGCLRGCFLSLKMLRKLRASLVAPEDSLNLGAKLPDLGQSQSFISGVCNKASLHELDMCVPVP